MSKVTYYLGAGASFHSMPLLNTVQQRLKIYSDYIFHLNEQKPLAPQTDEYLIDLNSLIAHVKESTSIDNYANELYNNQNHVLFKKLKHIVSGFFLFEQLKKDNDLYTQDIDFDLGIPHRYKPYPKNINELVKTQFDKRYRTFFNDYFTQTIHKLPANINIISWNYDLQLEGTYCRSKRCSLDLAQTNLNINPSPHYREKDGVSEIIKLNGTAGMFGNDDTQHYNNHIQRFDEKIENVLASNIGLMYNAESQPYSLSFAFEHRDAINKRKQKAKEIISQTNILVIIGYSFPKMNNPVDKFIFSDRSNMARCYLQVPANDYRRVIKNIERFDNIFASEIELYDDLEEFYTP